MQSFKIKLQKTVSLIVIFLLVLSFFPNISQASQGEFVWAKSVGGTSADVGYSVITDSLGNVYTTGYFAGTVDFDPGVATNNLTSVGSDDVFISKLNSSGEYVWAKSVGGTSVDRPNFMTMDSSNNIYITGYFAGTVDFDPGAGTNELTSAGSNDVFILKLNSSGEFVWVKNVGGTGSDIGTSMRIDSSNNIYVTGYFNGTADFDPGAGTENLTSAGSADAFILKLDSDGVYDWAKSMGGGNNDYSFAIITDDSGNVYTNGYFFGTSDFDPGAGTQNLSSAGSTDIYVSKLNSDGEFVWAKSVGSTAGDVTTGIAMDSAGNIYTTGRFENTVDFDPGVGTSNLTSVGSFEIYILKLNSDGEYVWAKSMGGTGSDIGNSLVVDSLDNVYFVGHFNNMADFDPGAGTENLTSAGSDDIFVSKLNSSGAYVWAKRIGGTSADRSYSVTVDSSDNVYATGYFQGTVDFDVGSPVSNLISNGLQDAFILKLGDVAPTLTEVTPIGVVVNNGTISYTFNTDQAGTITYGGSCSSATTSATVGNNTITLNSLSAGNYTNCTITVTDVTSNVSTPLSLSPFDIVVHSGGGGSSSTTTPSISNPITPESIIPTIPTIPTSEPITPIITEITTSPTQTNNNQCPANLILTQNLKAGARDDKYHSYAKDTVKEVKILQAHMNRLGFNSGKVDGILGPITNGAIKRMQASLGTKQDGLVGPITRDLINRSCN